MYLNIQYTAPRALTAIVELYRKIKTYFPTIKTLRALLIYLLSRAARSFSFPPAWRIAIARRPYFGSLSGSLPTTSNKRYIRNIHSYNNENIEPWTKLKLPKGTNCINYKTAPPPPYTDYPDIPVDFPYFVANMSVVISVTDIGITKYLTNSSNNFS